MRIEGFIYKYINIRLTYIVRYTRTDYKLLLVGLKVYYKTEAETWRFWEALKKLIQNNANTTFIVIFQKLPSHYLCFIVYLNI